MENELLAAEIYLYPIDTKVATAEIDAKLDEVEQSLKAYTCSVSTFDCTMAVASGILAGVIDAFVVGETNILGLGWKPFQEQMPDIVKKILEKNTAKEKAIKPAAFRAVSKGIPALIPQLEQVANQPTPLGLLAAVLVQIGQGGMLKEKDRKIQFFPDGISKDDGIILVIAAVIVGILKWLSVISSKDTEIDDSGPRFRMLDKICEIIRSVPAFSEVVREIEKWQRQLPNEIKHGNKEEDSGMGTEKAFYSLFMMLGAAPVFENTDLQKTVRLVQIGKQLGLKEIPLIKALSKQAFPVIVNEVIVRSMFFATRLVEELKANENLSNINWGNVLPFGNRDISQLLALSTMTLSVTDTADAAIHAAVDSCGEITLFATKFVTRFNYAAAGRAAVAVMREISNEQKEMELIHRKRLLTEAKTAKAMEILQDYQQQLEKRVCEYLAEHIAAFLEGLVCIDQGMAEKDSDKVIGGNVVIQRVLGREPQFTNQREFNDLMDSDIPLRL